MLFKANPANPIIIQYHEKRTGLPDYFYQFSISQNKKRQTVRIFSNSCHLPPAFMIFFQ